MATTSDFSETFASDLGVYNNPTSAAWDGTTGYIANGCAKLTDGGASIFAEPGTDLTIQRSVNTSLNFAYRITGASALTGDFALKVQVHSTDEPNIIWTIDLDDISTDDTGWIPVTWAYWDEVTEAVNVIDDLDYIKFDMPNSETYIGYVDDIELIPLPSPPATPVKFYFGQGPGSGVLAEKFTLPFTGVNPQTMTLDSSLGTVVIGSKVGAGSPTGSPVVYSDYPYSGWTDTATGFPTGTAISALKWV